MRVLSSTSTCAAKLIYPCVFRRKVIAQELFGRTIRQVPLFRHFSEELRLQVRLDAPIRDSRSAVP